MNKLFESSTLGNLKISNRVVMAPMTRNRAEKNVANELMAKYYGLRSSAGLIITEGTSPSANGLGYARIPGLFNQEQVEGWMKITKAVHEGGGKIFVQLMHTGRIGHPANIPLAAKLLAPSAIMAPGEIWTDEKGMQAYPTPIAMTEEEILIAIDEFAQASRLAIQAGFDGIEIHAANGYLVDQFLNTASNTRRDRWGGSIENRIRFAAEVAKASALAIGAERVGLRISPYGVFNGMISDSDMDGMYLKLIEELNNLGLVYVHIVDHSSMGAPPVSSELKVRLRQSFKGLYILSGGYDANRANIDLLENKCDLVSFGRPFISNPDLVEKLKAGKNLTPPDPNTFYTVGEKGYTDY